MYTCRVCVCTFAPTLRLSSVPVGLAFDFSTAQHKSRQKSSAPKRQILTSPRSVTKSARPVQLPKELAFERTTSMALSVARIARIACPGVASPCSSTSGQGEKEWDEEDRFCSVMRENGSMYVELGDDEAWPLWNGRKSNNPKVWKRAGRDRREIGRTRSPVRGTGGCRQGVQGVMQCRDHI